MSPYVYADTSALAKRYWHESDTESVLRALSDALAVAIVSIGRVELVSATFRAARRGDVPQGDVAAVLAAIQREWDDFVRVPVDEGLIRDAVALVQKYPLRAYDAVHLAAALAWQAMLGEGVLFLAFDRELLKAASAEGLVIQSPPD